MFLLYLIESSLSLEQKKEDKEVCEYVCECMCVCPSVAKANLKKGKICSDYSPHPFKSRDESERTCPVFLLDSVTLSPKSHCVSLGSCETRTISVCVCAPMCVYLVSDFHH